MKILIVDDNAGDVYLLEQAFQELNSRASLVVARDGDECLMLLENAAKEQLPELIFLDLGLPGISGQEVLVRIKGSERTRHIPVIVLSAGPIGAAVDQAYEAHANAYVQKPTTLDDLVTAARGLKTFWMDTARLPNPCLGS